MSGTSYLMPGIDSRHRCSAEEEALFGALMEAVGLAYRTWDEQNEVWITILMKGKFLDEDG